MLAVFYVWLFHEMFDSGADSGELNCLCMERIHVLSCIFTVSLSFPL